MNITPELVMLRPGARVRTAGDVLVATSGERGVRIRLGSAAGPVWALLRPLLENGLDLTVLDRGARTPEAALGQVVAELRRGGVTVVRPEGEQWGQASEQLRSWALHECDVPAAAAARLLDATWDVVGTERLRATAASIMGDLGLAVRDGGSTSSSDGGDVPLRVVASWDHQGSGAVERWGSQVVAVHDTGLRHLVLGVDETARATRLASALTTRGRPSPEEVDTEAMHDVLVATAIEHALRGAIGSPMAPVLVGPGARARILPESVGRIHPVLRPAPPCSATPRNHADDEAALDRQHDVLFDDDLGPLGEPHPLDLPQVPVPVVIGADHAGAAVCGWGATERIARRRAIGATVERWVAEVLRVDPQRVVAGVDPVHAVALLVARQRAAEGESSSLPLRRVHAGDREVVVVGSTQEDLERGEREALLAWQVLEAAGPGVAGPAVLVEGEPAAVVKQGGGMPRCRTLMGLSVLDEAGLVVLVADAAPDEGRTETPEDALPTPAVPVLAVSDLDHLAGELSSSREAGGTCVPVVALGSSLLIGPVDRPGAAGCAQCAVARYHATLKAPGTDPMLGEGGGGPAIGWTPVVETIARDLAADDHQMGGPRRALVLVPRSPSVAEHRVIAVPGCPVCDDGSAAGATTALASETGLDLDPGVALPPSHAGSLRQCQPPDVAGLREVLVDHRFGPVAHLYRDLSTPLAFSVAELVVPGTDERIGGYGRASDHDEAERVALLEALERDAGAAWAALKPAAVRASATELGSAALDPRTLGLPEPARVHRTVGLRAFDPEESVDWLPAIDLSDGNPVLVPAHAVHHRYPHRHTDPPLWLRDTSNGCALGASLTEAALHGLMELIERDAFLLAWWGRRGVRGQVRPDPDDRLTRHLLDHAGTLGYDIRLLDITSDVGVPSVVATARARDPQPGQRGAFYCAAGANPDPAKAAAAAVVELVTSLALAPAKEPAPEGRRAAMVADPYQVRTLEDHVTLHEDPAVEPRWGHLWQTPTVEAPTQRPWPTGAADLREVLGHVVSRCEAVGSRALVVDITTPAVRAAGLRAAKVLAPGLIPMSFGHAAARVTGLPRLDAVLPQDPIERDLALDPHPFP